MKLNDAAKWLRELSEPWLPGEKTKTAIQRVADLSGLHYWRAFDIWYSKARRIKPQELEAIANAIESKNEQDGRDELAALKVRIAKLESLLAKGDTHFRSPSVDQARTRALEMASPHRHRHRSMAGRK